MSLVGQVRHPEVTRMKGWRSAHENQIMQKNQGQRGPALWMGCPGSGRQDEGRSFSDIG